MTKENNKNSLQYTEVEDDKKLNLRPNSLKEFIGQNFLIYLFCLISLQNQDFLSISDLFPQNLLLFLLLYLRQNIYFHLIFFLLLLYRQDLSH